MINLKKNKIKNINNDHIDSNEFNNIKFLKWQDNSCRYNNLFFLFCYIIKPYIDNHFIEINNEIYHIIFKIVNICLSNDDNNILNNRIWELIEHNKISSYDLKKENTI